jgi:hypothetical protein
MSAWRISPLQSPIRTLFSPIGGAGHGHVGRRRSSIPPNSESSLEVKRRRACVYQKPYPYFDDVTESPKLGGMIGLLCFVLAALASPFKSKIRLEAENAALRHQLIVLRRKLHGRVELANSDRWFFIQL